MTIRPETIKSLEQNIEGKLIDVGLGIEFLGLTPKQRQQKENKHVKLYPTEKTETNSKIKRQLKEQKKISANYLSNRMLISYIYKELIQLNSNKHELPS